MLALALISATSDLPLPRFWYINRSLWVLSGFGLIFGGSWMLRNRPRPIAAWQPQETVPPFQTMVLYTREGCHLCEDALDVLQHYANYLPPLEMVDVDTDPVLAERYGHEVPVVVIDGIVRFRGRVNELLLRRLIEGAGQH